MAVGKRNDEKANKGAKMISGCKQMQKESDADLKTVNKRVSNRTQKTSADFTLLNTAGGGATSHSTWFLHLLFIYLRSLTNHEHLALQM